jgi:hypothetical protein
MSHRVGTFGGSPHTHDETELLRDTRGTHEQHEEEDFTSERPFVRQQQTYSRPPIGFPRLEEREGQNITVHANFPLTPLQEYIGYFLEAATAAFKNARFESPTSLAAGLVGLYMPVKILTYVGMTASQLGTLTLIAAIAESALKPINDHLSEREDGAKTWKLAVHVINTAIVAGCIATAFGVALPTAKGMLLTAGLITGVKYVMTTYMQSEGSRYRSDYSERHRY